MKKMSKGDKPTEIRINLLTEIHSKHVEDMERDITKRVSFYSADDLIRKEGYGIAFITRGFFVLCQSNGNYIAKIVGEEEYISELYNDYINGKIDGIKRNGRQ